MKYLGLLSPNIHSHTEGIGGSVARVIGSESPRLATESLGVSANTVGRELRKFRKN
jgi:hypothetical protein